MSNWEAGAGIREHLPGSSHDQELSVPCWPVTASAATSAHAGDMCVGDASPKAHGQQGDSCENTAPIPVDITTFTKRHTTSNRCFAARCCSRQIFLVNPRNLCTSSSSSGKHQSLKEPVSYEALKQHFSFQLVTISKRYQGKIKKGRCCRRKKINGAGKAEGEEERWETKKERRG